MDIGSVGDRGEEKMQKTDIRLRYTKSVAVKVPPNKADVEHRHRAAREADANLRLEGLTLPESAKLLRERWISGEIDSEKLMALTLLQVTEDLRD